MQKGKPRTGQIPERGVVEVKPAGDDAWLTADTNQVSRYWGRYRLVLVTNTRDFVLVGEDAQGNPVKLETCTITHRMGLLETTTRTCQGTVPLPELPSRPHCQDRHRHVVI